jgi:hypothetical protein
MGKRLTILILAFLISVAASGTATARKTLLRDGFVLTGIDGKLTSTDSNDIWLQDSNEVCHRWFFEFDSDVRDDKAVVKAGTSLELLPSSTLEKMTADMEKRTAASPVGSKSPKATTVPSVRTSNGVSYRLWGRVTKYKGKNFIFPIYFLPLSKVKKPPASTSQEAREKAGPTINDPNDVLTIPKEILNKLKTRKIIRPEQLKKGLELKQDSILADRTGFVVRQGAGRLVFVFDALGRNVQQITLRLLPCQALELAERRQSAEPDRLRFKIAGILTKYKGNHYLLLERTTRVYSHGNFGK